METSLVNALIDVGMVHSIHTSERRSFRTCRRKWDWIYNEGYHPVDPVRPLEFGTAYHAAMEIYYEPSTWHLDREVLAATAIAEFRRINEKQRRLCLDGVEAGSKTALPETVEEDYAERVELGVGMLKYYFFDVAPKLDFFTPVKVEVGFEVPLQAPKSTDILWCRCDRCWTLWVKHHLDQGHKNVGDRPGWVGLPVTVGGRLDMLAKDDDGRYWIFDWKTTSQLLGDFDFSLFVDDQISTYLFAFRRLGIDVAGFIYHEQLKAYPEPPEPLKRAFRGRLFSVAQNQATTYEMYRETVEEGDPHGFQSGLYDAYLNYLQEYGPKFFNRRQLYRTDAELLATEEAIYLEYMDMQTGGIYPNPSRFFCNNCPFKEPCLAKNQNADFQYSLDTLFAKG